MTDPQPDDMVQFCLNWIFFTIIFVGVLGALFYGVILIVGYLMGAAV